jgi:hypothetical protein
MLRSTSILSNTEGTKRDGDTPVADDIANIQLSSLSSASAPSLDEQLNQLYIQSEAAEARSDREEALRQSLELYKLVASNRTSFSARHCFTIGNSALTAEKFEALELAQRLYQLAYELDPEHSNNIQNYADFIIVKRQNNLYPLAEELLAKLKQGKHADYRPERTIALEAQLQRIRGTAVSLSRDQREKLRELLTNFREQPIRGDFVRLVNLFMQVADYDALREVSQVYYAACTSDEDRHLALLLLADGLWDSRVEYDRQEAMDLYHYLLTSRLAQTAPAQKSMESIEHNYATLLYAYDYDDEAGRLWFDAYRRDPADGYIQRGYSQYLLRADRPDLAEQVIRGEPVPEMVLQPHNKDMPEWFLDQASRWWELPDDLAAPAASHSAAAGTGPAEDQLADLATALQDSSFDWSQLAAALNGGGSSSSPPSAALDPLGAPSDADAPAADPVLPPPSAPEDAPLADADSSPTVSEGGDSTA